MRKTVLLLVLIIASTLSALSQTKTIKGTVVDSLGNGIASASITVKGTKNGTAADAMGSFTLSAKEGDVLVISALNFLQQELTVGTSSEYQVTLQGPRVP
jgi:iron complex outermembrane receptor protein